MKLYVSLIVAGSLVGVLVPAAAIAAPAASSGAARSATAVVITTPDQVRIDRQDPPASVTFRGVSTQTRQRVDWGDGGAVVSLRGRCTPDKARRTPAACKVTATHTFTVAGQFTIRAVFGTRSVTRSVTVAPAPQRWQPPDGWVQPAGWATLGGANFTPCQNVHWYFDAVGLPSDRSTLKADVAQGLALLAAQTGLRFTEVATGAEAQLVVSAADLRDLGQGWASMNPSQPGSAQVTLNWSDPYTSDVFQGFDRLHLAYVDDNGQLAYLDLNGRGWVVTRLLMLSLGFMFVDDPAQLMHNDYEPAGGFGSGDLDGLHTMYLNLGCPLIPD